MSYEASVDRLLAPKWRGQPGRIDVWYATVTDSSSGLGLWVHEEIVAPALGSARLHGWAAVFPPSGDPVWDRFGPTEIPSDPGPSMSHEVATAAPARFTHRRLSGTAGRLAWDLEWSPRGKPMFTFPRAAWGKERLPAAQIVPAPDADFSGAVTCGGETWTITGIGAVARIYGHGNAKRWGWLHGDLGDGEIIEVVAATSTRRGLDRLPPLAFAQIRFGGRDWPARPEVAAPLLRCHLGLPNWTVAGTVGSRRLRLEVTVPTERSVSIGYEDPDGTTATCVNSEVADAEIALERWRGRWKLERRWTVVGRAHAEVGSRP